MLNWQSLPRPIIALSPMADMTDSAFCRVVRKIEATSSTNLIVFREMVSSEAVVRGNDKTMGMTAIHSDERPLVQQVFGSDPAAMAEAARLIAAEHQPDGFDINMGCPVYKIVHNFNGAALMKEPARSAQIVKAMKAAITVPLSVKIRLGWSDPNQCVEFAKVLEDAGADMITVHGRTKCQGYAGTADWKQIGEVKRSVNIPVICNGDIHRAELVSEALKISGGDGVLIARGALGNPWIFSQIQEMLSGHEPTIISLSERLRVIRLHAKLHLEQYGPSGIFSFRKHLIWYFKGLPGAKVIREQLSTISSPEKLDRLLDSVISVSVP